MIQISNTLLNQGISHCLYNIGHITKAIICLKFKEGDNSYSENRQFYQKSQLIVSTKCSFCCHSRETCVKTKNTQCNS